MGRFEATNGHASGTGISSVQEAIELYRGAASAQHALEAYKESVQPDATPTDDDDYADEARRDVDEEDAYRDDSEPTLA